MGKLITHNSNALRFLMTEDLYDLGDAAGGLEPEGGGPRSEVGGLRSEVGGLKSEVGGLRWEEAGVLPESQITASSKGTDNLEQEAESKKQEAENQDQAAKAVDFNYLGENNRYFLVLVDDKSHPELNSPHKDLLMKIMAAKKLELRDLAILNVAKYPDAAFGQLKDFFSCNRIILFGIDPKQIGLPAIGANEVEKHFDVKVLATYGLEEMRTNTDKKREFWNVMKDF